MASYALVESDRPLRTYEREQGKVGHMRFMITCRIPVEKGNELVKNGTLGPTVQSIMEDLKPEAAYFVDVDGARGAHIVVDMEEASQIPLGGTPHARVRGRNRGPPRDGPGGLG